jgi:hypothetical protein
MFVASLVRREITPPKDFKTDEAVQLLEPYWAWGRCPIYCEDSVAARPVDDHSGRCFAFSIFDSLILKGRTRRAGSRAEETCGEQY